MRRYSKNLLNLKYHIFITVKYVLTFPYDRCGSIRVVFAHFHNEPLVSFSMIRLSTDLRNSDRPMGPYVAPCPMRFCPIQWKPSKNINIQFIINAKNSCKIVPTTCIQGRIYLRANHGYSSERQMVIGGKILSNFKFNNLKKK